MTIELMNIVEDSDKRLTAYIAAALTGLVSGRATELEGAGQSQGVTDNRIAKLAATAVALGRAVAFAREKSQSDAMK